METIITQTGHFTRRVEINHFEALPGSYQLQFSSRLGSARFPEQWQRNFGLILGEEDLRALRDALSSALAVSACTQE